MKITKILSVLIFVTMAGCTIAPTMEELETQALYSGDWSQVEKRERSSARRNEQRGSQCPGGHIAVCESRSLVERCSCVSRDQMSTILTFQ